MSEVMDAKPTRTPGGKLALWLFYGFCLYTVWSVLKYFWVISNVTDGDMGSLAGKLLGALMGLLVLGSVAAVLGGLAWYTRAR